ncbi:hypothetical protein CEUSTIGMA_g5137.t1 [Chlamydomonas eustigma]|uniref:Uncharacterized protein n=1 Tax=Chlamydomonas eustigma TaxID=1157962 RepID=A0A250X3P0_9CHLO|nr:hypothetical protein CEUSTIGMA_g5137.t1 [Chlamydomonas eustigma]|eukprot:GAX77694.1 hypothetical protein CEUSTIGMA_g5137.t1 [Chlamydomonas eustigma]
MQENVGRPETSGYQNSQQQPSYIDVAPSQPYNLYQNYQNQGYQSQGYQQSYQQGYAPSGIYQDANLYSAQTQGIYSAQQQYSQYATGTTAPVPSAQGYGDAQVFMPNLSPLNLMTAGTTLLSGGQTWGQQYVQNVQQRMSWLSGGAFSFHFNVTNSYVFNKVFMLFAPFLKRWNYSRQHEQAQGGQTFLPPRADINSPDLYLPVVSAWTYIIIVCALSLAEEKYKPDLMYSTVWSACVSWLVHALLLSIVLRAMNLPATIPWVEVFAYTGYAYVPACAIILAGVVGGKWFYYGSWLYSSLSMAVFLIRTLKRTLFQEARNIGRDMTLTNYLLLTIALFQLPFLFWLSNVTLPHQFWRHVGAHVQAAAAAAAVLKNSP